MNPKIRQTALPLLAAMIWGFAFSAQKAAADLDFMAAAKYRDEMWALQQYLKVWKE